MEETVDRQDVGPPVRGQFHTLILCTRIPEASWTQEAHWDTTQGGWVWAPVDR